MEDEAPHVAILPSIGIGHLISLIEFSKKLVDHHNFHTTLIIPTIGSPPDAMIEALHGLPSTINHIFLPPVQYQDMPENDPPPLLISRAISLSLSPLRQVIKSLVASTKLVVFIADAFAIETVDVAEEFNVPWYVFLSMSAMCLSLFLYLPTLDDLVSCEYRDIIEPVKLPGCIPIQGNDLFEGVQDLKSEYYVWLLSMTKRLHLAKGIMVNTFKELEPGTIKVLQEKTLCKSSVYAIGPLIRIDTNNLDNDDVFYCLKWLDDQAQGSVIFVSFGSGGRLSTEQMNELAFGLEMSEHAFLWVVKSPNDESVNAAYFNIRSQNDPFDFLPRGFLERTKGRGLVMPSWAPQIHILSHESTGGFLTHCGWNSVSESIVNGVPMIAWPLFAEQKMNAVLLTNDIKVAIRPKVGENGLVVREEISEVVKNLMGREERKRMCEVMSGLKEAAAKALAIDGDSPNAISELAMEWTNHTEID
ncbi:hydroquinone glucosyltransferase-like [Tripterygium wilfordii]|uniref:Glycosyltransferase n=1 Tax=Tripterygium wilfordii TaxID=458696 RepID=A0A7J7CBS4_TRIWF|nr:hydroquinone glucosyltransferase-like [Tripterygium wilfordii]KAF5731621.1 hydroquinone glucosyltransferase-like [Tripterygium wilfordii]